LFVVQPPEGVKQGQVFTVQVVQPVSGDPFKGANSHNIPIGRWRNGFCDCFEHGGCNPTCCLAFWCTPLALGQVMTRVGLNFCANPTGGRKTALSAFKFLLILYLSYIVLDFILNSAKASVDDNPISYDEYGNAYYNNDITTKNDTYKAINAVQSTLGAILGLFLLVLLIKTRGFIRQMSSIPGNSFKDCCASFWCSCCTVTQMAFHTADYNAYSPACCSDTGLSGDAPPVTFPSQP
jgi:Cys-rich protein (TIGR01571 family)